MAEAHPLGSYGGLLRGEIEPIREISRETPLERAVSAIREGGLEVWYESDYRLARRVAALCPECRVYSSHGHLRLIEEES